MNTSQNSRILVVDDEEDICEIIKFNLETEGYIVDTCNSAEQALKCKLESYQLFIFDVMMPGMSGFKLADSIRKALESSVPFIFLTAKTSENDKITGFTVGAEDYISKPFSLRELLARVKVVLRRYTISATNTENNIKIAGVELDISKKKLYLEGLKIELTPHEYNIMEMMLRQYGRVFTREEILNIAWKGNGYVIDRTVDVHITRLRKKLGEYGKFLKSRSGHGYCFEISE